MPAATAEEKLLQRRVQDALRAVMGSGFARCTGFLSERERQLAVAVLNREGWTGFVFDGGFEGAERQMLCVFEDNTDIDFPLAFAMIELPGGEKGLTHRDFLGAVLGCGIDRACVGDILLTDGGAAVALQAAVLQHIEGQLTSVGRAPARVQRLDGMPAAQAGQGAEKRCSVASLRLDAVLAAALDLPRGRAAALVESERVQVNHRTVAAPHQPLREGDMLSIRGVGRVQLSTVGGQSKKGRIRITCTLY